ncbi:MAG: hypothetical protein IJ461_11175 [Clostridia bacterium]|nr:hypothetical protein [Clostridia bacterium]
MDAYLKTRLAARMDQLGLRLVILILSLVWFISLWGLSLPALAAALAMAVMGCTLLRLGQNKTTAQREAALRQRIGGEIALEEVLTCPPRKAHFQGALWLSSGYTELELLQAGSEGVLCQYRGQTLLVSLIAAHPSEKIGCGPLLALQRNLQDSQRAVALLTAPATREAQQYAAQAQPPIRLIPRETLQRLAGVCAPATDEQLVLLGKRHRPKQNRQAWLRHILAPHRTRRYLLYGLGLLALYGITRLPYYPVPGVILLCLALLSRAYPRQPDRL